MLINWNSDFLKHPLFYPIVPAAQFFSHYSQWPNLSDYNNLLVNKNLLSQSGMPLVCISQPKLKSENFNEQYEPSVYLQGKILTRANCWHDFFNLMVWLTFPKTKAEINAQQYRALQQRLSVSKMRTMLENVLTLFDENGAIILSCNEDLLQLLKDFQWRQLFWERRAEVITQMRCYVFGHSIYEKALNPYLGMTSSSIIFLVAKDFFSWHLIEQLEFLDDKLCAFFNEGNIKNTKELMPLPILGIPGWDKANDDVSYYDNVEYFRAKKHEKEIKKLI